MYVVLTRYGHGLQNTIVSEPRSVSTLCEDGFLAASIIIMHIVVNIVVMVSSPALTFLWRHGHIIYLCM